MNTTNYKSRFGHQISELPMIKIFIVNMDSINGKFRFTYEIARDLGIKDFNGNKKFLFRHSFSHNTNFLEEKWAFLENQFKTKNEFQLPYVIKEVDGKKYLNLIFRNDYFSKIREPNENANLKIKA